MPTVNLDSTNLPKYCALDKIRADCQRYIDYYVKARGRKPDRLQIDIKYAAQFKKAIRANDDWKVRYGDNPNFELYGLPVEFV